MLGKPIAYRAISAEKQQAAMVTAGMPVAFAQANTQALELFASGDADWITDDVPRLLSRPARTFSEFAADNASTFLHTDY